MSIYYIYYTGCIYCIYYTGYDGEAGLGCYEAVIQKELSDIIIYSGQDFFSRYNDCMGRH